MLFDLYHEGEFSLLGCFLLRNIKREGPPRCQTVFLET